MANGPEDDPRSRITDRKVLVIVGAGVSVGATGRAGAASWLGLLGHGVEFCEKQAGLDPKRAEIIRREIDSGDLDDLLSAAMKSRCGLPKQDPRAYFEATRRTKGTRTDGAPEWFVVKASDVSIDS